MIEINNMSFSYSKAPFIEGMSFSVDSGEIFGFLGPSGAGKSTLQKILIGLLIGYSGSVRVFGEEVRHHGTSFYERIGIDFEVPTLYEKLTARQNLDFFSIEQTFIDKDTIDYIHYYGKYVYLWTVNEAVDIKRCIDIGVDGIITDNTDMAKAMLEVDSVLDNFIYDLLNNNLDPNNIDY